MMSLVQPDIQILEDRIGYQFHNTYLLQCALTHTSFAHEQKIHTYDDYERLEFLGDAVLEMVSSAFLYRTYPQMREGEMTKLRSSLVCELSAKGKSCAEAGARILLFPMSVRP